MQLLNKPPVGSRGTLGAVLAKLQLAQGTICVPHIPTYGTSDSPKRRKRSHGRPYKAPSREAIMAEIGKGNVLLTSLASTFGVCRGSFMKYADSYQIGFKTRRGAGRHYLTDSQFYGA